MVQNGQNSKSKTVIKTYNMDNLNSIPKTGSYGSGVDLHNDNYQKIGVELQTLRELGQNNKGYFETLSALQSKYPTPQSGWQAYVKDAGSSTGYYVANVNSSGNWVVTAAEAPPINVDLAGYAKTGGSTKTVKEVEDEIVQLAGIFSLQNKYVNTQTGELEDQEGALATDYLAVDPTKPITITGNDGGTTLAVALCVFYDKFLKRIGRYTTGNIGFQTVTIQPADIPDGTCYIRSSSTVNQQNRNISNVGIVDTSAVFARLIKDSQDNIRATKGIFTIQNKYVNSQTGGLEDQEGFCSTDYLAIDPTKPITITGVKLGAAAIAVYYDEFMRRLGYYHTGIDGYQTVTIQPSDMTPGTKYIRATAGINQHDKDIDVRIVDISASLAQLLKTPLMLSSRIASNNVSSQRASLSALADEIIESPSTRLRLKNKSKNGVGRIAFRFKYLEDINVAGGEVKLLELKKDDNFFNVVVRKAPAGIITGKESPNFSDITTEYPIPYFNSGYGIRTNLTSVPKQWRNINYDDRTISLTPSKVYKPICGHDIFSVRLKTGIISESQALCAAWSDLRINVTDSGVGIISQKNELSIISNFADFDDMLSLVTDFGNKIKASVLGDIIEFIVYDAGGRKELSRYDDLELYYAPSDMTKCDLPLVSTYPIGVIGETALVERFDSFPAYISKGVDDSWHTFELISTQNSNRAILCIDGQWLTTQGNMSFDGIRTVFAYGADINIAQEIAIKIKDLVVQYDEFDDAEVVDGAQERSHIFCSSYHPIIINFFGHDIYYQHDAGLDFADYENYHKYVSQGGYIPDELNISGYKGDDAIPSHRTHLAYPSYNIERLLKYADKMGYVNITHRQVVNFMEKGTPLPKRCYMLGFDDVPTYIYADERIKSIFKKYNCNPYFALEPGYYVSEEMTSNLYDIPDFITTFSGDTNEHRLQLQKRLQYMKSEECEFEIHGYREGLIFQCLGYRNMIDAIKEGINVYNQLGLDSRYWCVAGNYYTPNSIKMLQKNGISYATSTHMVYTGICHNTTHAPRRSFEETNADSNRYLRQALR